jgi:aarF domain-containing kinase
MKDKLADECHYSRETSFLEQYRRPDCLGADARFKVSWVWPGSTECVLGISIRAVIGALLQEEQNKVCTSAIVNHESGIC